MNIWDFGPQAEPSLSWEMKANVTKKHGLGLLAKVKPHLGGAHHAVAGTKAAFLGHGRMEMPRDRCTPGSVLSWQLLTYPVAAAGKPCELQHQRVTAISHNKLWSQGVAGFSYWTSVLKLKRRWPEVSVPASILPLLPLQNPWCVILCLVLWVFACFLGAMQEGFHLRKRQATNDKLK